MFLLIMSTLLSGLFCFGLFASCQVHFVSVTVSVSESNGVYAFVPTIGVALEDMQQRYPAVFFNHTWTQSNFVDSSTCNLLSEETVITSLGKLSGLQELKNSGLTVIIQPTCGESFRFVGDLAREMDFLAVMCTNADDSMMNKKRYPSLVSFGFSHSPYGDALTGLMDKFSWKRIVVLWDQLSSSQYRGRNYEICRGATDGLLKRRQDITYIKYDLDSTIAAPDYKSLLLRAARFSRVIMLCSFEASQRQFLAAAHDLDMISGDYVFIFAYSVIVPNDYQLRWNLNNSVDQKIYAGLSSVLILVMERSSMKTIDHVMTKVQQRKKDVFNQPIIPELNRNDIMLGCYFAVESVAQVLNESYAELMVGKFVSGTRFARKFASRNFPLENRLYRMTPNLTRITYIDVQQFDATLDTFEVVFQYNFVPGEFTSVDGRQIRWQDGAAPPDQPKCGFQNEKCNGSLFTTTAAASAGAGVFIIFTAFVTCFTLRFYKLRKSQPANWMISADHLTEVTATSQSKTVIGIACDSQKVVNSVAICRGQLIWKSNIITLSPEYVLNNKPLHWLIQQMMNIQNANINTIVGVCLESTPAWVISNYCKRGSLAGLTVGSENLDWDLKSSLIMDLINGIDFIHKSQMAYHGSLTTTRCLLDNFFGLQIADLGYARLRILAANSNIGTTTQETASQITGLSDDIYQFGSITFELVCKSNLPSMPDNDVEQTLIAVIMECRHVSTENKLTAAQLKTKLDNIFFVKGKASKMSLVDRLLRRLEKHAEFLESAVFERTLELREEQQRCDDLLLEMLPKEIIRQLRMSETVMAQLFDSVTILFSDIPGFTEFVAGSGAYMVVEFLHNIYSNFDQVLETFLVYKVETIADSYMIASGLPVKHDKHVMEVCEAALAMQARFHKGHKQSAMKLRIGIHTGPVAGGIVGSKSPRYCLFGNTVNTASRMESHGLPSRIHVSEEISDVGRAFGLKFAPRGEIYIKGKGLCTTFWLEV